MFTESRLTRRSCLKLAATAGIAALAGTALTSCKPTATPAPQATQAAPAEAKATEAPKAAEQAVKLVFWRYPSLTDDPVVEVYQNQLKETHPNVEMEVAAFGPMEEYRQKILASVAAKTTPDLLFGDGCWLPEFASRGIYDEAPEDVMLDLTTNFTKGMQGWMSYKGKVYGYPWDAIMHALYTNDALFEAAGMDPANPPVDSFSSFLEGAQRLAKVENGEVTQAGFLANPRLMYLLNFLWANDAKLVNENEYGIPQEPVKCTLGQPKAAEVWKLWYDMYNVLKVANAKLPAHITSFQEGLNAMCVTTSGYIGGLKKNFPDLKYHVAPMPTNIGKHLSQWSAWQWVVLRDSPAEKKTISWDWLRACNTVENIVSRVQTIGNLTAHLVLQP
jgi:multiple sugar transport system substrate-binding protein